MSARGATMTVWATLMLAAMLATSAVAAETDIRFTLNRKFDAPAALFLLPLDRGYYKTEGLNVSISPANGLLEPIKRVAAGDFDMGVADINALIKFRDADPKAPVKAVFVVYNQPPYAVIGRKSRGISRPKDLEGKKLGAPADGAAFAQWPIFVKANGIDAGKVTIENIGSPLCEPMLAAGQVDAVTGFAFSTFSNLKDKGVPVDDIVVLRMADYGVDLYGDAIIVNSKFAAAHGEAVGRFLRAFLKGLKQTVRSPMSAVSALLQRNDAIKKDLAFEQLRMIVRDDIVTPEVSAQGYGGIDDARFAHTIDQIALTFKFNAKPKPNGIFDASYLPPAAERKYR